MKRKFIWVAECHDVFELEPSDFLGFYHDDIYGDTYKNKKDYWELVEDEK